MTGPPARFPFPSLPLDVKLQSVPARITEYSLFGPRPPRCSIPYSGASKFLIQAAWRLVAHQRPHVSGTVVALAWLLMALCSSLSAASPHPCRSFELRTSIGISTHEPETIKPFPPSTNVLFPHLISDHQHTVPLSVFPSVVLVRIVALTSYYATFHVTHPDLSALASSQSLASSLHFMA